MCVWGGIGGMCVWGIGGMCLWGIGGMILTGETEVLGEKLYTVWVVDE
jgi:hypothetical protein